MYQRPSSGRTQINNSRHRNHLVPTNPRRTRSAYDDASHHFDSSQPVNYSGTQVNIYGQPTMDSLNSVFDHVPHNPLAAPLNTYPYGTAYPPAGFVPNVQLGLVTEHMLRKLDESRLLTMSELMRRAYGASYAGGPVIQEVHKQQTPRMAIELPDSTVKAVSPGHGDWKGQLQHVYAHLMEIATENRDFRQDFGAPQLGEITAADLEEKGSGFVLTLTFAKPGSGSPKRDMSRMKPKPKKAEPEEPQYEKENIQAQEGTLKPYKPFSAEQDAEAVRKAMKGLGTDENAISTIFGKRTAKQRLEVIKQYKTMFGKDLIKDLKSELSGEYWNVVRALCFAPSDYDAAELRNAIKGLGTDNDCVIEIICTRTNKSLQAIQESYKRMFNKSLEEDIMGDTSGHFQRLLVALLQANREDSDVVDRTLASKEAQALYDAGARKWGTDESRFNQVLVTRSYAQLRATFKEYERLAGKSVEEAVKSEMSGDLSQAMTTIVRCVQNKAGYFAKQLYKAIKGLGTDDTALVRIIVSRCEVDMVQIKDEFQKQYKQSLGQFISDDTSGDYRKVLLLLIGDSTVGSKRSSKQRSSAPADNSD